MAEVVRYTVRAKDSKGGVIAAGIDYGDGTPTGLPGPPIVECGEGTKSRPDAPTSVKPSEESFTFLHAYRRAGVYPVRIVVRSAGCNEEHGETEIRTDLQVVSGPLLSNGPLPPTATGSQAPTDSSREASLVYLALQASDLDGFISRTVVDWGDGSPTETLDFPLSDCVDPVKSWPISYKNLERSHRYIVAGDHVARITVTSVGCDGKHGQTVTATTQLRSS